VLCCAFFSRLDAATVCNPHAVLTQVASPFKNSPRLQSFFRRQDPAPSPTPPVDVNTTASSNDHGSAAAPLSAFDAEFTPRVLSFDAHSGGGDGGGGSDESRRHKEPRLGDSDSAGQELTRDPASLAPPPSETTDAKSDSAAPRPFALKLPVATSHVSAAPVSVPSLKLDLSRSSSVTHEDSEAKQRREKLARFEPEATPVSDRVFVGGESPALNLSLLQKLGITHIVNCAADTTACAFEAAGHFKYLRVHINDSVNDGITSHIPAVFAFMDDCLTKPEGRCLVHCTQGVSRSVSFCVAREMVERNCDYDVALATVKAQRAVAAPNAGSAFPSTLAAHFDGAHTSIPQVHVPTNGLAKGFRRV
jgi:hypothetical protein